MSRADDVIDVSRPFASERTFGQAVVSFLGAASLAVVAPLAILAVGTPVAVAVRGALELARWLIGFAG